jgi:type 1 fimbria pilin
MSKAALPSNYDESSNSRFTFDPKQSCNNTFSEPEDDKKQHVKITFGSGYLKGYFVEDQCTIGDITSSSASDRLVLPNYTFGMVTEETCFHNTFDAIIGMAYPEFAEPGIKPFFDSMMDASILKKDMFAFYMSMNPDNETSEVTFGDWNSSRIADTYGDTEWHSVQHKLFWSILLDKILVDGEDTGLCNDSTKKCLFTPDTGTSLITFPTWATTKFNSDYPEYSNGSSCDDEYSHGNLTYVINGIEYPIPSHHWMSREVNTAEG